MRAIALRIGRRRVYLVELHFVFVDVGVVERLLIMKMARDLATRRQSFFLGVLVPEKFLVLLKPVFANPGAEVTEFVGPFVGEFDDEENHAAEDRDRHVKPVLG